MENVSKVVDVERMRRQAASRIKAVVSVSLLVGAVVLVVMFREPLTSMLFTGSIAGGVPVRLTVTSNPPTSVVVLPGKNNRDRSPLTLGRTPILEASGVFVGDIVVLTNEDMGIHWEKVIEYSEPNRVYAVDPELRPVTLKVQTRPALKGATVWRRSSKLGMVNVPLEVYPGRHELTIHADQLVEPFPFEVVIDSHKRVTSLELDISEALSAKSR